MQGVSRFVCHLMLASVLWGCSAALVPYAGTVPAKLDAANSLLQMNRPLPAERLMVEAVDLAKKEQDTAGLADAYVQYGRFFLSPAVKGYARSYRQDGFMDKEAIFDRRAERARYYLELARETRRAGGIPEYGQVDFWISAAYHQEGDKANTCLALRRSLETHAQAQAARPSQVEVLEGYATWEAFIAAFQKDAGCDT